MIPIKAICKFVLFCLVMTGTLQSTAMAEERVNLEDWQSYPLGSPAGEFQAGATAPGNPVVRQLENGNRVAILEVQSATATHVNMIQAEKASQSGGVTFYPDPDAWGGKAAGEFGNTPGDYLEFQNIAKTDRLNVHYNNGTGSSKQAGLYLNGKRAATLVFEDTGDWFSDFHVVSYEGKIEGTVRIQIDQEDFDKNTTFCCNIDAISFGEPPSSFSGIWRIPIEPGLLNSKTHAISLNMRNPKGGFFFGLETNDGKRSLSTRFNRHELDTEWGRFTFLVSDLEPLIPIDQIGHVCSLIFKFSGDTEYDPAPAIGEIIASDVWPSTPPEGCPTASSEYWRGIRFTGRHAEYTNADTWYPSWASDDVMYSPYTDGMVSDVFVHSDFAEAMTGMAEVEGSDPLDLKVTDLGFYVSRPWPFATRYPCGSLVHEGVWYYGTYIINGDGRPNGLTTYQGPFVGFRISKDFGKTWTETPCTPLHNLFGELVDRYPEDADQEIKRYSKIKMGSPHFVDFGRNMEHSPDGKAYLIAHGNTDPYSQNTWIQGDQIYLARVKPSMETINDRSAYEFYGGKDLQGNPLWVTDFSQIQPVIEFPGHCGCVTATWIPGAKKYVMCISTGKGVATTFDTWLLESERIEGPWKLISFMESFGRQAYFVNIPSKFISNDGNRMWLCYSSNWTGHPDTPRHGRYAMSLREFELLRPTQ